MLLSAAMASAVFGQTPPVFDPDRLSTERMETLVADPLEAVRAGRWDDAVARLETARARALADPVTAIRARADLDESFGVLVDTQGQVDHLPKLRKNALPFLDRAIAGYRQAFGDRHPEVALALQTWADVLVATDPAANAPRARDAYCEAFRIRLTALGPTDASTGAALAGVLRLAPSGTADARTMSRISPALPTDARPGGTLLEDLAKLRLNYANDRAGRDLAYRTLATDPRYLALCPTNAATVVPPP